MNTLNKQIKFIMEIDKLKVIYRQTTVKEDNNRQENSAEHSWHISLAAIILEEYADKKIDITRVIKMLLIHDIIEIDAGDLFAFEAQENQDLQEIKEKEAAQRLFSLLPQEQEKEFKALWFEFEACISADACFAKSIDRILPLFINMRNNGGSWVKHTISKTQVLKRNAYLKESSPKLWFYVQEQVELAVKNTWLSNK